jgi:hypothetical protein
MKGATMALTDQDLEGFELAAEAKPDKTSGVTISQIPPALVKMLEEHAPKALGDSTHELVLRAPVRVDTSKVPEVTEKSTAAEKAAAKTALDEATAEAQKTATATVKLLASYATAWGKGQTDPRLYITKVPNRKDMPDWHARLSVKKWDDVPKDNRPGRR